MRFRKSIKICKGVKLNVSKSGISTTVGHKGFSVTTGKRGTYLNTGIPGTGISARRKIGGSSTGHSTSDSRGSTTYEEFDLHMDTDGTITIMQYGQPVTDEALIQRIKRSAAYKEEKARLSAELKQEVSQLVASQNEAAEQMIQVVRYAEAVPSEAQVRRELSSLKPEKYMIRDFTIPQPSEAELRSKLEKEAETAVATFAFWKAKKLRMQYVDDRFPVKYEEAMKAWQAQKAAFDDSECSRKAEMDEIYQRQYEAVKECLAQTLEGNADYIENALDKWFQKIELPLDFAVQYEYDPSRNTLYIDLDLPEIEDIPDETAVQMANGTMKVKKKTQQKLREEYAQCVFGFSVFIASHCFGVSIKVEKILISGYTQRRNKIGDLVDDYVYSVVFERSGFENINLAQVDPIEFCTTGFKNRCNMTKTFVLKAIEPYETGEIL